MVPPRAMNSRSKILSLIAGCALGFPVLQAQVPAGLAVPPDTWTANLAALFHGNAAVTEEADNAERVVTPHDLKSDVLVLRPMVVKGTRVVTLPPPFHEPPILEFFRTGTLLEKVGTKFALKLWLRGGGIDGGLRLTVAW